MAIGGGTGLPAVLEGLCHPIANARTRDAITAIVTVTDDGGSSGRLRDDFAMLPPGDARNCLVAIAQESPLRTVLQHRFSTSDGLDGHALGNLMLAALTQVNGDFAAAIQQLGDLLGLRGRVLPTTSDNVRLRAEMDDGSVLVGETAITTSGRRIRRLSLTPRARPLPDVMRALVNADAIVVGPGSLYSSILPNLLVEGVAATISGVKAVRIYVANLMTEPGETDAFTLDDHLRVMSEHAGSDLFDYVLVNRAPVSGAMARRYAARGSRPVPRSGALNHAGRAQVVEWDLAASSHSGKIRHHPRPLAEAIRTLVHARRP